MCHPVNWCHEPKIILKSQGNSDPCSSHAHKWHLAVGPMRFMLIEYIHRHSDHSVGVRETLRQSRHCLQNPSRDLPHTKRCARAPLRANQTAKSQQLHARS